jgi:hypothetical protein
MVGWMGSKRENCFLALHHLYFGPQPSLFIGPNTTQPIQSMDLQERLYKQRTKLSQMGT